MTLTDDLTAAEAQARGELRTAALHVEWDGLTPVDAAIDHLAAVCRLAGRWEVVREYGEDNPAICAELARLMEGIE